MNSKKVVSMQPLPISKRTWSPAKKETFYLYHSYSIIN